MSTDTIDQNLHIYYSQDETPRLSVGKKKRSFVAYLRSSITVGMLEIIVGIVICFIGLMEIFSSVKNNSGMFSWDRHCVGVLAMLTGSVGIAGVKVSSDSTGRILFMAQVVSSVVLFCASLGESIYCWTQFQENGKGLAVGAGVNGFFLCILSLFSTFSGFSNLSLHRKFSIERTTV